MLPEYPGVQANFFIDRVPIASFDIIAGRMFNLDIDKGILHAEGQMEYSPESKSVSLDQVLLQGALVNYYFTRKPVKPREEKGKASQIPVTIKKLRIENSEFGLINKAAKPDYRVYIEKVNATAADFSTGFARGPATLELSGDFMGSGETRMTGKFRSEEKGPDFDLKTSIRNTNLRAMNNIFRAYGNFDVSAGKFSFFTELHVKNGKVDGYLKPIFKDMKVYDERQDEEKDFFQQAYEAIAGALSELLENPRESIATKAPVRGRLKNPHPDTWTAIVNLARNAFFHSILPGFAESIGKS
jgi:hypothetical protein